MPRGANAFDSLSARCPLSSRSWSHWQDAVFLAKDLANNTDSSGDEVVKVANFVNWLLASTCGTSENDIAMGATGWTTPTSATDAAGAQMATNTDAMELNDVVGGALTPAAGQNRLHGKPGVPWDIAGLPGEFKRRNQSQIPSVGTTLAQLQDATCRTPTDESAAAGSAAHTQGEAATANDVEAAALEPTTQRRDVVLHAEAMVIKGDGEAQIEHKPRGGNKSVVAMDADTGTDAGVRGDIAVAATANGNTVHQCAAGVTQGGPGTTSRGQPNAAKILQIWLIPWPAAGLKAAAPPRTWP